MKGKAAVTVGLANMPRRSVVADGVIIRYGFQPLGDTGYAKYIEHIFKRMPSAEELQSIVSDYNAENGINEVFNASDYGFRS